MQAIKRSKKQAGYTIVEMMIATAVMVIVTGAIASLLKNSFLVATATYEMTDAQESLRSAQEWINRDLMNAGDGLKLITYIPVNTTFVTNYITTSPISDSTMPSGATNMGILSVDNNAGTTATVPGIPPLPSATPQVTPSPIPLRTGTDRQTILQIDPDLVTNPAIYPTTIAATGDVFTLPSTTTTADMAKFTPGEIYFVSSSRGGTFATLTALDAANKKLTFGFTGDACGLNTSGANNRIKDITVNGTLPATVQRVRIIQYYVDSNKILKRRVFGDRGATIRDTTIADHVLSVQFVYSLGLDSNGDPVQPTSVLSTPQEQVNVSQVEVTVTVETPHMVGASNPLLSSTTSTSLRNMQFRQALQPKPSPSP